MAVIYLNKFKNIKKENEIILSYKARLFSMDKLELLEEMVLFQHERTKIGHLTIDLILLGRVLFELLEKNAETHELKLLSRSYRRHLEYEYNAYMKNPPEPIA